MPLSTVYKEPQKQTIIHSAPPSLLVLHFGKKDLVAMKVLILACLVALALARQKEESVSGEIVESFSSSEESVTHIDKKVEKFKLEEQQQTEDALQDKIHPFSQPQPLVYPYNGPIPYPILPQNILPLAQPPVVVPFLQPEIMEVPKAKETILPKHKEMPFSKSPVEPFTERQSLTLTDLENLQLPLPLLQSWMHPHSQPLSPTLMFPSQPLQSLPQPVSQPQALPIPQQVVPYPQREMPTQALLLYQEPVVGPMRGLYPIILKEFRGPKQFMLTEQLYYKQKTEYNNRRRICIERGVAIPGANFICPSMAW
ncbi:beta-casein [Hippopotamus amphibius kiboko]|uniref:beta-casein n=1 Tax=Hippopotamus amphibius kiboko TaxID=575201 RepID=UPI002591B3C2|nr:beta-casein [Hippopotamus amphibius kiboko]